MLLHPSPFQKATSRSPHSPQSPMTFQSQPLCQPPPLRPGGLNVAPVTTLSMPDSESFYEHEFITRLCERFITHLFACPECPPTATHSQAKLPDAITYPLHHTRLHTPVTSSRSAPRSNAFDKVERDRSSPTPNMPSPYNSTSSSPTPSSFMSITGVEPSLSTLHARCFEARKNIFNIGQDPMSDIPSPCNATRTPSLFLPAQEVSPAIEPSLPLPLVAQLEARNSVFNNVGQNQYNQSVVINNLTLGREDLYPPTRYNVDLNTNHHFPGHAQVVTSTTTFTTTNIAAAALYWNIDHSGALANLVSLTVKITSFRYSFFSNTQPD
jgi:hypothetical protein